ncbi:hypothetical protein LguiB_034931 [Lonicera macranthoides]
MERLNIKSWKGKAKVIGTLVCIGGSLVCTFWKAGFEFKGITRIPLICISDSHVGKHNNLAEGSALLLISYIAYSACLILQAAVSKIYPAPLSINVLTCFFAALT